MIKHVERNLEHEKAVLISEKYKEFNKNTQYKQSVYDPVLRIRRFEVLERDPRAIEIKAFIKPETHNRKDKLENKAINSKVSPTQPKSTKVILKENSLRGKIYKAYQAGQSKQEIAESLKITIRRVSSEIGKRNLQLGVQQADRKNETRLKVEKLLKKETNLATIGKQLGIARNTVLYHYNKIQKLKVPNG